MIPSKNLGSEDPSYIRIAACRASVELTLPAAISSLPQISSGTLNRSLRRNVTSVLSKSTALVPSTGLQCLLML